MKNRKEIIIIIVVLLLIIGLISILINNKNNLIKLSYSETIQKIENKDTFILCVSASECIHCEEYKPKLKKIANKYDIKIYYVNIDDFTDEEYETFKKKFSFDGATPVTIFFKNGEEKTTATRIEGNTKTEKIIEKLKNNGFIKK